MARNNGVSKQVLSAREVILNEESPFALKEAYKSFRTNIIFSLPGTDGKVIGFTSAMRGDGKSTNCINTAISFAELGKKVILIDGDMRLPTVGEKLDIPTSPGLSDVLVGASKPSDAIIKKQENLYVLPAGRIPKDPTGLLQSKQIQAMFAKLKDVYEYVFIDLPPVTTVTDAAIIAPNIDGYVLVVRHEKTDIRDVNDAVKLLKIAEGKIIGILYNDAPTTQKKYYSYYKK
jgi:capsular exopolysaccharide family